ncbi:MAG: 2-phosphosulfolactate phosphatase [Methanobacteriaceae archaeon]|jgi:2-phosphosulfolactate phosphatase|nr:MAG: 2-phosphosulfolactate phosphatase [Methanobacterium sp. BRmetb2]MCC7557608.1 2-phosphosulfolactate phosphatase [Methanobacteriaceae archaeon]
MKISLSLEKSITRDVAIMVDVLRASTTITVALENFNEVIPVKNLDTAESLAEKYDAVLAGERGGASVEWFDAGNSPIQIKNFKGNTLVLTTSNGTRIIDGMQAEKILIGSFVNAESIAESALKLARNHIEIVMAGVDGRFAIEDFLGAGEIISYLKNHELDEYAIAALMASSDKNYVDQVVKNSNSALKLADIGFVDDVEFCLKRNIYDTVPLYEKGKIEKLKII